MCAGNIVKLRKNVPNIPSENDKESSEQSKIAQFYGTLFELGRKS